MKKVTGWILIVFCSVLLLVFALALIVMIPDFISKSSEVEITIQEMITSFVGFLIMILLLALGLREGIKKVKREKIIKTIDYKKELNIELKGKIAYKDYRNLILGLSFKKPIYIVVLGVILLFGLSFFGDQTDTNYFMIGFIIVVLISPLFTLFQIKRIYNTNSLFHEEMEYKLTNESMQIKGDTMDSTQKWSHFYQMKETKQFFMFYQGKMVASFLDKKMFSENDLKEFKKFIQSLNISRT
jgi:fumarate reductase subunit D